MNSWKEKELERRQALEAGRGAVCNITKDKRLFEWGKEQGLYIYIGRGSNMWGNPYKIPRDGNRQEVCRKFEEYYFKSKELQRNIHELKGKLLGCYCYPEQCHGDFLSAQTEKGA